MTRRVLIISPHFPPVNAPDLQRVRMSLPYLREFGWTPTILAVNPRAIEGAVLDPLLQKTIPTDADVIRVGAISAALTRAVGLGNLALRALPYLWHAGNCLLSGGNRGQQPRLQREFDVVYFSTTQFPVTILGPIWKRRFGLPYVVDFQDPWLDDYYERTGTPPPGGKAKHRLSRGVARLLEPRVMRDVSQVISVSPAYGETLLSRYPHLHPEQFTILPFGALESDFQILLSLQVKQSIFDPTDGKQHWVYAGVVGPIMAHALRLLFAALQKIRGHDPERWKQVRLHFVGTSYAPAQYAAKTVEAIANECGVSDIVEEQTNRLSYFEALQALRDAHVLMVIGADSPEYSPSKLYPYMFARKPLLAVLHRESPAVEILQRCRAGEFIVFDPNKGDEKSIAEMAQALQRIYDMAEKQVAPEIDEQELRKYTAREMTRRQCDVFNRAVEQQQS